jgi:hypothetical protein
MKTKDEKMASVATLPFRHADLHARDILGHIPSSKHPNSTSISLGDLCVPKQGSYAPAYIWIFTQGDYEISTINPAKTA